MQTDNIITTCLNNSDGFTCTTPSFFSGGDMFISFLLLLGLIFVIIGLLSKAVFAVKVHKEYTGVNQMEGKEHYKI